MLTIRVCCSGEVLAISFLLIIGVLSSCMPLKEDTVTTISEGSDTGEGNTTSVYDYFTGSTVSVSYRKNDGSYFGESGIWCSAINSCSCGIAFSSDASNTMQNVEFSASINGSYPPFTIQWDIEGTTSAADNVTFAKWSGTKWIKLSVTDSKGNSTYFNGCNRNGYEEIMMYINIP
jgi:hypothetical protein